MKFISFNTGRGYTVHGQRIAATQLTDGRVQFVDIDRGINHVTQNECELTQAAVMRAYDACDYGTYVDYAAYAATRRELEVLAQSSI
jgi:hypothetical protein